MWPFTRKKWQTEYTKVEEADAELQENFIRHKIRPDRTESLRAWIFCGCIFVAKCFFAISWILLACKAILQKREEICVLGNERIFEDVPVIYESVRFQRAGFHDTRHDGTTTYEGLPNSENEAAWDRLLDVGVVSISEDESLRISNGTATTRQDPKEHFVELEMFHQFHCLKWIRDQFWDLNSAVTSNHTINEFPQRVDHTDHCIDYLRQVIMCHGDITPITFEWIPEIHGYIAHHSTEHQCRSFDAIYDWAKSKRIQGMEADGRHQNVELKHPENFD